MGKTMSELKSYLGNRRAGVVACLLLLVVTAFCAPSAEAQTRLIVRDSLGLPALNLTCLLAGCKVVGGLGDPNGQLFLVTLPAILNPVTSLLKLSLDLGILDVEVDQVVTAVPAYATNDPNYLTDETPTPYYGATVWHGYLAQPGNELVRTPQAQATFNVTGAGATVAVIDTGVDPNNAVLKSVLVNGYDFTRNVSGGSEMSDVQASPNLSQAQSATLSQRTVAVLDQRTVDQNVETSWGATLGGGYYVWRSGVGVTRDGRVIFVYGPALDVRTLAGLLRRAGCVDAMQLDINPDWVAGYLYVHHPTGPVASPVVPGQLGIYGQLLAPDARDFLAVVAN